MSWSPQREARYAELVQLARKSCDDRREFTETIQAFAKRLDFPPTGDLAEYLRLNAGAIRDLLEPFDDRPKKIDVTGLCDEAPKYLREGSKGQESPMPSAERMLEMLQAIAQAVKPLRDWYYAEQRPADDQVMVFAPSYGRGVSYGQLVRLLEACPRLGAIVDVRA